MGRLKPKMFRALAVAAAVVAVVGIAWAATLPFTFKPKTAALSGQVNANFKFLSDRAWEQGTGGGLYHTGNVGVAAAKPAEKLEVTGKAKTSANVTAGGNIKGKAIRFRQCAGGLYSCNIKTCLALCQKNGERMATKTELFSWASAGNSRCISVWMLDAKAMAPRTGYPMYLNQKGTGCGPANTGDVPRMIMGSIKYTWTATAGADCACHTL